MGFRMWTSVFEVHENYPIYPPPIPITPRSRLLPHLGSFSRSLWHILPSHLSQHIKLLMLPLTSHTQHFFHARHRSARLSDCGILFRGWGQQGDVEIEAKNKVKPTKIILITYVLLLCPCTHSL